MQAFILAAGLGTRLRPITNNIPKALVEINGVSLLERLIIKFKKIGVEEIVINVHFMADKILDFLKKNNNFDISIIISDETDKLLDTGGAIRKVLHLFDSSFFVYNVDIVSDIDLMSFYYEHINFDAAVSLAVSSKGFSSRMLVCDGLHRFSGLFDLDSKFASLIFDIREFRLYNFAGIHIIDPSRLSMHSENEVFSIIDFYLKVARDVNIFAYDLGDSFFVDAGTFTGIEKAGDIL